MYHYHTFAERYTEQLNATHWRITRATWKNYMIGEEAPYYELNLRFPQYQAFLYHDGDDSTPVAIIKSIPLTWDGTTEGLPAGGIDGALGRAFDNLREGISPNTLCAITVSIDPAHQAKGISSQALLAIKSLAVQSGLTSLIVPVRPSMKAQYPLTPMRNYVSWKNEDGTPFDPWLRVHCRLGGQVLSICDPSMILSYPVKQWEAWTGMKFPESGQYVVAGALNPITIDLDHDCGRYVEPNVWVYHKI